MTLFFKKWGNRQRGSTLIELLLYMGIFSILTAVLLQLFTSVITTQLEAQSTSSVLIDSQYLINRFNYDIKRAENIVSPPVGSGSTTLEFLVNNATYTYTLTSGNITIASSGAQASDQLNSNNTSVSNLSFTHLRDTQAEGADTITVSFTLTSNISRQEGTETKNYKTTVGIRPK